MKKLFWSVLFFSKEPSAFKNFSPSNGKTENLNVERKFHQKYNFNIHTLASGPK